MIIQEWKMLYNKFFVAPIDKASGNVAFVCQKALYSIFYQWARSE